MTPEIIERDQLKLIGMVYYGNPFHAAEVSPDQNEVGKLWGRFNTYYENNSQGFTDEVNPKVLPAGQYAVFTLKGEQMTKNWGDAIYKEWLPGSDYEEAFQCTIERYDEDRFTGWGNPDSEVEIWVPVIPKA